jgi:hypothetical protein
VTILETRALALVLIGVLARKVVKDHSCRYYSSEGWLNPQSFHYLANSTNLRVANVKFGGS